MEKKNLFEIHCNSGKICQFHVGDKESVVAEGADYYLSVMFHHKNHLTRSLTREATGVR